MVKMLPLFLMSIFSSSTLAATYTFEGGPIAIPTVGPADPGFIEVEGVTGKIVDISVELIGAEHKYAGELMTAISNPDGWTTLLWSRVPCRLSKVNMKFSDSAPTAIRAQCTASGLPSGDYLPGESNTMGRFTIPIAPIPPFFLKMNELIQEDINGRWILWVEDFSSGDDGKIQSWKIVVTTQD